MVVLAIGVGIYAALVHDDSTSKLANKNTGVRNTNININVNTVEQNINEITNINVPVNSEVNPTVIVAPHDTTAASESTKWQTIKYQHGDHGLSLDIPTDWTFNESGMGLNDGDGLFSAYGQYGTSQDRYYLNLSVIYHKNDSHDTLAQWVEKYKSNRSTEFLFNEPVAFEGENKIFILNIAETHQDYTDLWGFIDGGDRVYEINFSGSVRSLTTQAGVINDILKSVKFIEKMPLLSIPAVKNTTSFSANDGYALKINWLKEPIELNIIDPVIESLDGSYGFRQYYKEGEIANGRYAGDYLVVILQFGEMGWRDLYRVVYDPDKLSLTYLEKYSDNLSYFTIPFIYDIASTISGLDYPTVIDIPNSKVDLAAEIFDLKKRSTEYPQAQAVFTDASMGAVYFDPQYNCYFIVMPDGMVRLYHLKLKFIKDFAEREHFSSSNSFIPEITWSDGNSNSAEYTFNEPTGGCGSSTCHAIFTEEEMGGLDKLKAAGKTSTGDKVYEYIDKNNEVLRETYDQFYLPQEDTKPDYETFTASHPFFYWKDPFDHWVRFKQVSFLPAVECGKPVIYLYPEQTTKVNVQVAPNGGFSLTDPVYPNGGWNVTAHPNGELEYDGMATYPYLFWEGFGFNYEMPKQGFVVKNTEVAALLQDKLTLLGLNAQEKSDFLNFWVPKLQDSPYYFITFVDQSAFEKLAPLTVAPAPDSIIRVFMDYQPLESPYSVEPLNIKTPQRYGFTVVEWGGALH
ncbi:MAG: hypothetical protein WCV50_03065 [Patescibacteria group bacterium]